MTLEAGTIGLAVIVTAVSGWLIGRFMLAAAAVGAYCLVKGWIMFDDGK